MEVEKILRLVEAGFSKEEIKAMLTPAEPPKAEPKAEPKAGPKEEPKAEPKEEPKAEPSADIAKAVSEAIAEAFKPFEDIYNKMAKLAGMPSIMAPEPITDVNDIISKFFND